MFNIENNIFDNIGLAEPYIKVVTDTSKYSSYPSNFLVISNISSFSLQNISLYLPYHHNTDGEGRPSYGGRDPQGQARQAADPVLQVAG